MAEIRTADDLFDPAAGESAHHRREELTVVSVNAINPLPSAPTSDVVFFVNGIEVVGITNAGTAVTVNPSVLGHNIGLTDRVTVFY